MNDLATGDLVSSAVYCVWLVIKVIGNAYSKESGVHSEIQTFPMIHTEILVLNNTEGDMIEYSHWSANCLLIRCHQCC